MKIRVAQCWDDGVATDIRLTKILKKYHAKATFNLCPGNLPDETVEPWWLPYDYSGWTYRGFRGGAVGKKHLREVYGDFQVAVHNWKHETAGVCTDAEFIDSAKRTKAYLEETFQKEVCGFAWPNGRSTPETVQLLKDAGFKYGRTTLYTEDVRVQEEPLLMKSNCHFLDMEFWKKFLDAKEKTGVFYFWGHSYEMMDSEGIWKRMEDTIRALSEDPDVEWVNVIDLVR